MFSYFPIMCPKEAHINPFWGHPLEKLFDIYKLPWEEISEKWSGLYHQRLIISEYLQRTPDSSLKRP